MKQLEKTKHCYNISALAYAETLLQELDGKSLDRMLLERFAKEHHHKGLVGDLGCGPGQTTRFLQDAGLNNLVGIDLSAEMIKVAQDTHPPSIDFIEGNMLDLDFPNEHFAGLIAFYAIVHFDMEELAVVFQEVKRVLRPQGQFLFSFHVGEQVQNVTDFFSHQVDIDFHYFDVDKVLDLVKKVGLEVLETVIRYPYLEVEYPSQRAYVLLQNCS